MDKTADGGFVIAGKTSSSSSAGYNDIEITKIDGRGIVQWHRLIGGSNDEGATGIRQTPDGGYIVVGYSAVHGPSYSDLSLVQALVHRRIDLAENDRRQLRRRWETASP